LNKINLKIGFIGAGSIGSLFGGYLSDIKSDIYSIKTIFFCIKAHAEEINTKGLKIHRIQELKIIKNIKAYEKEKNIEDLILYDVDLKFDFLFLTTKAYDIDTSMLQYKKLIEVSKYLVILQNGIGNEEVAIKYCSRAKIIRVVTTNGALLDKPGHIIHTGEGITKIGFPFHDNLNLSLQETTQAEEDLILLRDILNLSGLETIIVRDIIKESWEKVFVNIGINAVGTLTRLPNGKLLENESIKYIMVESIKEAIRVAEKKEINLPKRDYISITYDVANKTAENRNSMLQDILNGHPTEIDFINGRILKYAEEMGIRVPFNKFLTFLIKGLEQSRI
jgi:2-dehydropantoate 2-reductase